MNLSSQAIFIFSTFLLAVLGLVAFHKQLASSMAVLKKRSSMRFSLRTLLVFTAVASVLLGLGVRAKQHANKIANCQVEFRSLAKTSESLESKVMTEVLGQELVKDYCREYVKQSSKSTARDVVVGLVQGNRHVGSQGYFWAEGDFEFRYDFALMPLPFAERPRKMEQIVDVTISSNIDMERLGHHEVVFSYPDTELNTRVAKLIAAELMGKKFDITTVFQPSEVVE